MSVWPIRDHLFLKATVVIKCNLCSSEEQTPRALLSKANRIRPRDREEVLFYRARMKSVAQMKSTDTLLAIAKSFPLEIWNVRTDSDGDYRNR